MFTIQQVPFFQRRRAIYKNNIFNLFYFKKSYIDQACSCGIFRINIFSINKPLTRQIVLWLSTSIEFFFYRYWLVVSDSISGVAFDLLTLIYRQLSDRLVHIRSSEFE